jgi:hypothetical protein
MNIPVQSLLSLFLCLSNTRMTRSTFKALSLAVRERSYSRTTTILFSNIGLRAGYQGHTDADMQLRVVSTYMDMLQAAVSNARYMNRVPRGVATETKSRGRVEIIDPVFKSISS